MITPTELVENSVYSNFDCVLDEDVVKLLKDNPSRLYAHHSAWDFSGNVWFDAESGQWVEEVWRYHMRVDIRQGDDLLVLIESVNNEHGWK